MLKPGTRLKSAVCDTEVIVIRGGDVVIECGGVPMAEERPGTAGQPDPAFSGGTRMGKRYVDEGDTIELLCVKPGPGSLAIAGLALVTKGAKPLPSSD